MERSDLKTEIENLQKQNDERVKEIEKLKSENWGVREEVSEFTKSLKNIVERMKINELNFNELCKEKSNLKNKRQPQKSKLSEGKGD